MAVCLVTGGAGFIGSHLVEALVARGDRVRVLDNFSTGALSNLEAVRHRIELILGEIDNQELLERAVIGVERLYHLASPPGSAYDEVAEPTWVRPNETLQVLLAARAAQVARVVCASSYRIYGQKDGACAREGDWVLPDSAYGFAKLASETQCLGFTSLYGLEVVRLRYAEVFGPRQCPTSPYASDVPRIVQAMLAGTQPVLDETAPDCRDLVYVDDAVHATILAGETPRVAGSVFNIARGSAETLLDIVAAVNELLGTQLQPVCPPERDYPARRRNIDTARAERELGFCPGIDLRQGLQRVLVHDAQQGGLPLPNLGWVLERRKARSVLPLSLRPVASATASEADGPAQL